MNKGIFWYNTSQMDFRQARKDIGRFSGWLGLRFCSFLICFIPEKGIYGFARIIATLGYLIAVKQRRIALESLGIAFAGEKRKTRLSR